MGIRGELFSTRVSCEGRTYFFNVKQNRMGDVFLSIVESKPTEPDTFDRRSIVVFGSDVKPFIKAFQKALGYMEKPRDASIPLSFDPADAMPVRKMRKRTAEGESGSVSGAPGVPDATGSGASAADASSAGASGMKPATAAPGKKRRIVVKRAKPSAEQTPGGPGKDDKPKTKGI